MRVGGGCGEEQIKLRQCLVVNRKKILTKKKAKKAKKRKKMKKMKRRG
jgi:hypothetical protein